MKGRTAAIGCLENINLLDAELVGTFLQLQYNGLVCSTDQDKLLWLCLTNEMLNPFTGVLSLTQVYTHENLYP